MKAQLLFNRFNSVFYILILLVLFSCNDDDSTSTIPNPIDEGVSQYGEPFDLIPENKDIIMYEVNLRAFSPEGDLQGVIDRLDSIKALSVNVIWLMPIHPIGEVKSVNSPYSIKDFYEVSEEYGSLEDLRNLTDAAHERGMAVIMDWVANHTSWDNDWINITDWHSDDGQGNIIHPPGTNWLDVADLNYSNLEMREAMIDVMKYWVLEANIDGFRCDYADGVPYAFWKSAIEELRSLENRELIFFAEGERENHFEAGFDLNFGWRMYGAIKDVFNGASPNEIELAISDLNENISEDKRWVHFTTNHDESAWDATPMQLFGGKQGALAASVISIFSGGIPLIYGSQEVGTQNNIPFFSNSTINWSANQDMWNEYKRLLNFYSTNEELRGARLTSISHSDLVILTLDSDPSEYMLIVNVRDQNVSYAVPTEYQQSTWKSYKGSDYIMPEEVILSPYEYLILKRD